MNKTPFKYFENEAGPGVISEYTRCKNAKQRRQDQHIISGLSIAPLAVL